MSSPSVHPQQRAQEHTTAYAQTVSRGARALIRAENETLRRLSDAYRPVRTQLAPTLVSLVTRYRVELSQRQADATQEAEDAAAPPPVTVPLSWLTDPRGGNWHAVNATVAAALDAYALTALALTTAGKQQAVALATPVAQDAMLAAIRPIAHLLPNNGRIFTRPAEDALRAFAARTAAGGPLARLFDGFGPQGARALRDTLAAGLANGSNPRDVAYALSRQLDRLPYSRAEMIARTEMLGSYRAATFANFQANRDVVEGWQWLADKGGGDTCAACLAMDGQIFPLDQQIDDHLRGRCAAGPVTKGYADILNDLGIDADASDFGPPPWESYQSGADWLAEQDEATQRSVFGSTAAYNAWASGDTQLSDYAAVAHDSEWGDSIYQQSLRGMGLDANDYRDASE